MSNGLKGKRVVVTRAPHQADEFAQMLKAVGAVPVIYPAIQIEPPDNTGALDDALRNLAQYDWLLLTSRNTVFILRQRMDALSIQPDMNGLHIAAVGPSTAEAAQQYLGVQADIVPDEHMAEGLLAALPPMDGKHVFLPQSAIARSVLSDDLRQAGAEVEALAAYRTVQGTGGDDVPAMLRDGEIDVLTFTSASTVRHFVSRVGDLAFATGLLAGCIGPLAADAAREAGFENIIVPAQYTLDGLTQALTDYFKG